MNKPIKVKGHSLIDYGFFAAAAGGPHLLGLTGRARGIPVGFAVTQGTLNVLTDQPYALKRIVSFRTHGRVESVAVPILAAVVSRLGALEQPRSVGFFGALLASLATVYTLTDWDAPAPM